MGTYKGIQGYMVESLSSDPGTLSEVVGKLWYNSGSNVWKVAKEGTGAWSAGGDTNSGHQRSAASGITQTAATVFGGGSYPVAEKAESYDGTTWTEIADLNTARQVSGGAQMAPSTTALGFGGTVPPNNSSTYTEQYDGTSWSEETAMNTAKMNSSGFGVSTAAVSAGGAIGPTGTNTSVVEEYNGTGWTTVNAIPAATRELDAAGIITSGLVFGGNVPPQTGATKEYDGTNWTEGGAMNTAREAAAGCGATQTAALCFSGEAPPGNMSICEEYNGTAWTEVADLSTARNSACGAGTSPAALCITGTPPANLLATEEWNSPNYEAATVTTS